MTGLPVSSTSLRLGLAAALCVVPLGRLWSATAGYAGVPTTLPGACDADGYCSPGYTLPGVFTPGTQTTVAQSPVRLFLLFAAIALLWVATRTRTPATLRIARLAAGAVAIVAVLAAANGVVAVLVCALAALGLVVPQVRPRRAAT